MIKRESLRVLHQVTGRDCEAIYSSWGMMALNKDLFSASFCKFSHLAHPPVDGLSETQRKSTVDISGRFWLESGNRFSLKSCFDRCDGEIRKTDANQTNYRKIDDRFQKANASSSYRQLLHDSDTGFKEVKNVELTNGRVGYEHGNPLGVPKWQMHEKLVVAVDVDEVLGSFLSALNEFIADHYASNHSVSEYYVYEFCKIWKCSRTEADIRVHEFFKTAYFKAGIHPIPGAQHALKRLSSFCSMSVVTSRQNAIKDHTIEWIEKHYPGLFQEIHFGNHFALDGQSRPKSEICRSMGAHILIDDNPRYAIECAEAGMKVLLFDYNNSYPWCKTGSASIHPLVTKVFNWQEVERYLASCVMS